MRRTIISFLIFATLQIVYSQSGWSQLNSSTHAYIYCVYFVNNYTGFIGCDSGKVFKTTNGGLSWSSDSIGGKNPVSSIYFINQNTGFLGSIHIYYGGKICKTTNQGINWSQLSVPFDVDVDEIFFVNSSIGYIANHANILKTTNGGTSWDTTSSVDPYYGYFELIYSVYFNDGLVGFSAGNLQFPPILYARRIWKTINGGQNWSIVYSANGGEFLDINFVNYNTGFAIGTANGSIARTTDGGISWTSSNLGSLITLFSVFTLNENKSFIAGYPNLFMSRDGGISWSAVQIPNQQYHSIFFSDSNTGYVAGQYGNIFKTTTGGEPIGLTSISYELPLKFTLHQNYPNPFNPTTKIRFDIPADVKRETANVKLIIYDLLGRVVTTLVDEHLKPGTYEVAWDGSSFASGIYFYKLISGDFIESRKMVLTR